MRRIITVIAAAATAIAAIAAIAAVPDTRTAIYHPGFRTLRVHQLGNVLAPPVIELGSLERVLISFDEMATEMRYMRYRLIHCDANWNPSQLVEAEYLDGFNEARIDDYAYSQATLVNYVNYQFTVPNEDMRILVSGNYLVQVYDEDHPEETLLQARFYATERLIDIGTSITSRTDIDYNDAHQQLAVSVTPHDNKLQGWTNDITLRIMQNMRDDSEVLLARPTLIESDRATYEHQRELIFPAGNEFRRFEVVETYYPGMHVEHVGYVEPFYHATLYPDRSRTEESYLYDQTQFGRFVVRQSGVNDSDFEADYVAVHFTLEHEPMTGGELYVTGQWTQPEFNERNRMHWDELTGTYQADIMMKMGSYNYQYLWLPAGSVRAYTAPIEGDKYETVNEYFVRIYYRPPGARYDRLAGTALAYSHQ